MIEKQIHHYKLGIVDSTQLIAKREILKLDANHWHLWSATAQTAGYGRQGRSWLSPPNLSTYTTYGFCIPNSTKFEIFSISQVAAYSAVETLVTLGIKDAELKWPNDVLVHGKKISGALVEVIQYSPNINAILLGVSINVNTLTKDLRLIEQPATSMKALTNNQYRISEVIEVFSRYLRRNIEKFIEEGFRDFCAKINEILYTFDDKTIALKNDFDTYLGKIEKIDENGALLLSSCSELRHYNGTILKEITSKETP